MPANKTSTVTQDSDNKMVINDLHICHESTRDLRMSRNGIQQLNESNYQMLNHSRITPSTLLYVPHTCSVRMREEVLIQSVAFPTTPLELEMTHTLKKLISIY